MIDSPVGVRCPPGYLYIDGAGSTRPISQSREAGGRWRQFGERPRDIANDHRPVRPTDRRLHAGTLKWVEAWAVKGEENRGMDAVLLKEEAPNILLE